MANILLSQYMQLAGIEQSHEPVKHEPVRRQRQAPIQEHAQQQAPRKKGLAGVHQELSEMRKEINHRLDRIESELYEVKTEQKQFRQDQHGLKSIIEEVKYEMRGPRTSYYREPLPAPTYQPPRPQVQRTVPVMQEIRRQVSEGAREAANSGGGVGGVVTDKKQLLEVD